jgi:hypothetical protein
MKTTLSIGMLLCTALFSAAEISAEEVLTNRPLIIAPRRIEVPQNAERSGSSDLAKPSEELPELRLGFRRGSMRLTAETRKLLQALRGKSGPLRITGYGDAGKPNEKLANLRARAVASYIEEYYNISRVKIIWQADAYPERGIGVTITQEKE